MREPRSASDKVFSQAQPIEASAWSAMRSWATTGASEPG